MKRKLYQVERRRSGRKSAKVRRNARGMTKNLKANRLLRESATKRPCKQNIHDQHLGRFSYPIPRSTSRHRHYISLCRPFLNCTLWKVSVLNISQRYCSLITDRLAESFFPTAILDFPSIRQLRVLARMGRLWPSQLMNTLPALSGSPPTSYYSNRGEANSSKAGSTCRTRAIWA